MPIWLYNKISKIHDETSAHLNVQPLNVQTWGLMADLGKLDSSEMGWGGVDAVAHIETKEILVRNSQCRDGDRNGDDQDCADLPAKDEESTDQEGDAEAKCVTCPLLKRSSCSEVNG